LGLLRLAWGKGGGLQGRRSGEGRELTLEVQACFWDFGCEAAQLGPGVPFPVAVLVESHAVCEIMLAWWWRWDVTGV
jgi:hypothetical protein